MYLPFRSCHASISSARVRHRAGLAIAAAVALSTTSLAGAVTIGSGFSAMWFELGRNGEGLQLEILGTDYALVEWYTYNEQGSQRWIQGVGQIVHEAMGDSIQFPQLYVTHGGHFGPAFNPADVGFQVVGDATLSFGGCNTGTFRYHAFGQSQTLPLQRLTQTMGAGCTPINGVPGQPVMAYAGQSGSWFDPSHNGEGYGLQWLSTNQAMITWYTYDTQGNQVWLLGVGAEQPDGSIVFDHMARTHGPHFGAGYDETRLQYQDWGTLTLRIDCSAGTAHYASNLAEFGSGDLNLTRLTKLMQPGCPTAKPKLSDLYDITWNELPIEIGKPENPGYYLATESIANDGTVAGDRNGHLVLWHPGTRAWEDVPGELAALPVDISAEGSAVIATEAPGADPAQPFHILMWQRATGWRTLPGTVLDQSIHSGVSHNFEYVVGIGNQSTDTTTHPWIRAIGGAQQLLPSTDTEIPIAVSNDGHTIVGATFRIQDNGPVPVAIRWNNGGPPTIMHAPGGEELAAASACDADCNIVFGAGLNNDPDNSHSEEAWYLRSDGAFEFLGTFPDAYTPGMYDVTAVTSDGSLAVGDYDAIDSSIGTTFRAFIWTEATGAVSVRSLVDELGVGDDDWYYINTVRVSADGHKILLGGVHRFSDPAQMPHYRAVVLDLTPRPTAD